MKKSIRFLMGWRGRIPGDVNSQLDYGVMAELVRRHIAEWVEEESRRQPKVMAAGAGTKRGVKA